MGKPKIKLRTKEQATSYYMARPHVYSGWFKVWLWVLSVLRLAKKFTSREYDTKGRLTIELHGYAYKGAVYLTKQVVWSYDEKATGSVQSRVEVKA